MFQTEHTPKVSVEVMKSLDFRFKLVPHSFFKGLSLCRSPHKCLIRFRNPLNLLLQLRENKEKKPLVKYLSLITGISQWPPLCVTPKGNWAEISENERQGSKSLAPMLIVLSYKWITLRLFGDCELNQHSRKSTYGSQVFAHSSLLHDMASQRNKETGYIKDMPFIVHLLHVWKRPIACIEQKCCFFCLLYKHSKKTEASMWGHALRWKWKRPFSLRIHSCEAAQYPLCTRRDTRMSSDICSN